MIKFKSVIILILIKSILWPTRCLPRKRKNEAAHKLHRTGEVIADDDLIKTYEREHQKFYEEEVKNGNYLEWPALKNKILTDYCRKYLRQSAPARTTDDATGVVFRKPLHYTKENPNSICPIVIVQCKVLNKSHQNVYYMTKAPKPNCVYALKSTGSRREFILTIINKYCDFEIRPLKRKRGDMFYKIHYKTSQPIATDEYLLRYELEHQKLIEEERDHDNHLDWTHVCFHPNLNYYCYQYMGVCVPSRNRETVTGKWKTDKLHYQKLNTNKYITVTTVNCWSNDASKLHYHLTRAPETNCVYALLRQGRGVFGVFVIVFKHCDFEEASDYQTISNDVLSKEKIPEIKTEEKKEPSDTLESLQLFPVDKLNVPE